MISKTIDGLKWMIDFSGFQNRAKEKESPDNGAKQGSGICSVFRARAVHQVVSENVSCLLCFTVLRWGGEAPGGGGRAWQNLGPSKLQHCELPSLFHPNSATPSNIVIRV